MSTRRVQSSAIKPRTLGAATAITPWVRNPSWLALTAVGDSEQKFSGLVAVFPQGAYLALNATTSTGTYTVDWGDGSSENIASNTQSNYFIDFNDADLAGTDAPVTLTDAGDLVERTAHGYVNGMEVRFYNIVSTTGLTTAQVYYVINATTNNFQVTTIVGDATQIVALTTNGTATLLPYKQAIVNVTPTTANLSTFNLNLKNTTTGLQAYETGWLDIELGGPNLTASGLTIGGTNVRFAMCERAALRHIGSCTSFASLFSAFRALREVVITASTSAVTNISNMFLNCNDLAAAPLFNIAAVTNMESTFNSCNSLTTIPLLNTAAVTNMTSTFNGCNSLTTIPLLNTASVTNMTNIFVGCRSLTTIPLLNTAAVTNMSNTFSGCNSLTTIPLLNTAAVTNMSNTFSGCNSLTTIPLLNTAAVTNMDSTFLNCSSLQTIPPLNTPVLSSAQSMFESCVSLLTVPRFNNSSFSSTRRMFRGCFSLQRIPLLNTASVTDCDLMFDTCPSLSSIPALNFIAGASAVRMSGMFNGCNSVSRIEATGIRFTFSVSGCRLGKTELEEIFTNLPTVTSSQTITITNNVGIQTSVTGRSTTTTAQSTTSTIGNTASLANGMLVIGTGTGISTGIIVVSDVSVDTLTLIGHGLPDGTPVAFSSLGTTTGVSLWTIYYVVSTAANTFQVALNPGDAAIDLTGTGGNMTVRYANYITSITANTSIDTSTPMATSGTNNLDYRTVDSASALLKNWAVTH
jgi:surface protein